MSLIFGELSGTHRYGSDPALELFLEPFELCFEWVDSSYGSSAVQSLNWSTRSLTILNFNRKSISSEQIWHYIFHKNDKFNIEIIYLRGGGLFGNISGYAVCISSNSSLIPFRISSSISSSARISSKSSNLSTFDKKYRKTCITIF